jgi:micrococcal nuclease
VPPTTVDSSSTGDDRGADRNARCDPSYPTVCIPPPPPDLDCSDVRFRSFAVRPPDPHRFDGNGDGVGCEPAP